MLYVTILSNIHQAGFTNKIPATGAPVAVLPGIVSLSEFRFAQAYSHGGQVKGEYGTMTLVPELMAAVGSSWYPPPQVLEQVTVGWYHDDGSAYWEIPELFVGWLESWDANGAVYSLRERGDYATTETDKYYTGTLTSCFTSACSTLGLLLNTTYSRAASPSVDWLASGENKILDNLSNMAKFFTHSFYIESGTLYLIDCLGSYDIDINIDSSSICNVSYFQNQPINQFTADWSPPYLKYIRLKFLERQDGDTSLALVEADVAKSDGGTLVKPNGIAASAAQSGYPVTNLTDADTATAWVSGSLTVPGVELTMMVSLGQIKEYALQAYSNAPASPVKWNLYGRNEYTAGYEFIAQVQSLDWTALEQRRFKIPDQITWKVSRNNTYEISYSLGETMDISPVCQRHYTLISNALADIDTDITRKRCRYTLPIREIKPRQKVALSDSVTTPTNNPYPIFIASWIRVDALTYNFNEGVVTVEGGGDWSQI